MHWVFMYGSVGGSCILHGRCVNKLSTNYLSVLRTDTQLHSLTMKQHASALSNGAVLIDC